MRTPSWSSAELASCMGVVVKKLFDDEPTSKSTDGKELRYGSRGSLSVDLGKGTWKDFETGKGGGVLDLVQRELHCDRRAAFDWLTENAGLKPNGDARQTRPKRRTEAKGGGKRRVIARYVYTDAEARPVHCTLRWEPKSFSQQRFEAGEWVGGKDTLKGVQRVLYRLPELLAADPALPVLLAEGEKDADRLRSLGLVATTTPEGAGKWEESFARTLAGRHVVILPDNDPAGRERIDKVAASLHGRAVSVRVLRLEGLPEKGDVSDWLDDKGHTVGELQELIARALEWQPPEFEALGVVWADDIELDIGKPGLIDGLLGGTGMTVLYGESGSGKTFVAVDIACHIAAGMPWRGLGVEQSIVIYVAAENPASIKRRIWAWKQRHGVEHLPVAIVTATVNLLNGDTDKVTALIQRIAEQAGKPVAFVVIDTLARAMAGNENAPEDMGAFVSSCDRIREASGGHILVVHHSGKDQARGARGHSSLRAATDGEWEVVKNNGERSVTVRKNRDGEEGEVFGFRLDTMELGLNARGRMVTTCIMAAAVAPAAKDANDPARKPKGANQRIVRGALGEALCEHGRAPQPGIGIPAGVKLVVTEAQWRKQAIRRLSKGDAGNESQSFRRAADKLVAEGFVGRLDELVWLPPDQEAKEAKEANASFAPFATHTESSGGQKGQTGHLPLGDASFASAPCNGHRGGSGNFDGCSDEPKEEGFDL